MLSNNWKYVGYICFFIGLVLTVYGLSVYLDGPKEIGKSTLDCTYNKITSRSDDQDGYFYVCENPIQYEIYTHVQLVPKLILEREIKVIVTTKNKTISYAYLIGFSKFEDMPVSSNYSQWFESQRSLPNTKIIELKDNTNFSFKPDNTKSYAIFLIPNKWNESLDPSIIVKEHFTYKKIDFSRAWNGYFIAIFGSIMLLLGFLFGNPIDKIIIKICSVTKPLYSSNYKEYKEYYWRKYIFPWKWLFGGSTLIVILSFIKYPFMDVWNELPLDIKFVLQDYIIRGALLMFFFNLIVLFAWILFVEITLPLLNDLFYLFMERRGFAINPKSDEKALRLLYGDLLSSESLFIYLLTGVLFYISYYYLNYMELTLFSLVPLVFYMSYRLVISHKKACNIEGINDLVELKNSKVIVAQHTVFTSWIFFSIILFSRFSINMLRNPIQEKTIDASLLTLTANSILREKLLLKTDEIINIFSKEFIFYCIILMAFLYLSIIISVNYLLIPPAMRKQEAMRYTKDISIFLIAFTTMQIISNAPDFSDFDIKIILTKSLVVSIIAYFFTYSYRQLISQKAEKSE